MRSIMGRYVRAVPFKGLVLLWNRHHKLCLSMLLANLLILLVFQALTLALPRVRMLVEEVTIDLQESSVHFGENGGFVPISDRLAESFDPNSNTLTSSSFHKFNRYQTQPYVSNGYIGSRIPNVGHGFTLDQWGDLQSPNSLNGWPLFNERYSGAFIAGFYNLQPRVNKTNFEELYANGYESVISAIPQWTTLYLKVQIESNWYVNDPEMLHDEITEYSQTVSLSEGTVTTKYLWMGRLKVSYTVAAHRTDTTLGIVQLDVQNVSGETLKIEVLGNVDFSTSRRCDYVNSGEDLGSYFLTVSPKNLPDVSATIYVTHDAPGADEFATIVEERLVGKSFQYTLKPSDGFTNIKYVGIVSTDLVRDPFFQAKTVAMQAENALASHISSWSTLDETYDITFKHDKLLTMVARSSIFHLLSNTRPNAEGVTGALGVSGLSSDSYAGLMFWDADLWMFGAILPFAPDFARSLVNYRMYTHKQAKKNSPNGNGAVYPWTSGRFGNCTSTGPCLNYEYHINVAVAMAAWQTYLSGAGDDQFLKDVAYPLIVDAADFLSQDVAKYDPELGKYTTHNLTDPDEFANHIDNGAYTNAGIERVLEWAKVASRHLKLDYNPLYDNILEKGMHIPTSDADDVTLEFSGMNSSATIKQADVVMITYPLDNNVLTEEQALLNMRYYLQKQLSEGPAMTYPIFLLVSGKVLTEGCSSQSYLHKSVIPYIRGPFSQFLEQNNDDVENNGGTHPAFPFLTAHGGFVQAVVQGLLGLRFGYRASTHIERVLFLDPVALPILGNDLYVKGVKYLNQTLDFVVSQDGLIVKHTGTLEGAEPVTVIIETFARGPDDSTHFLHPNSEVIIESYTPMKSIPLSSCECEEAMIYNITAGIHGDVLSLINDGDNMTHWQAESAEQPARFLVDLKKFKRIKGGSINWGNRPAKSYKVYANAARSASLKTLRLKDFEKVVQEDNKISEPFSWQDYTSVHSIDRFNTTEFDNKFRARFIIFEFEGVFDDDNDKGAKVAEFRLYSD